MEDFEDRLENLITTLSGRHDIKAHETDELFLLHNEHFTPKEHGKTCSSCRSRVYKKMVALNDSIRLAKKLLGE